MCAASNCSKEITKRSASRIAARVLLRNQAETTVMIHQ